MLRFSPAVLVQSAPVPASVARLVACLTPVLVAGLCTSCGLLGIGRNSPTSSGPPPEQPLPTPSSSLSSLGLQPLPSPEQVTQAVQQGRLDPFSDPRPPAPTPEPEAASTETTGAQATTQGKAGGPAASRVAGVAGASGTHRGAVVAPKPPPLPAIRLTGVIQSHGKPEAIVVVGGAQAGSLRPGDRGGFETRLLPPGWTVEAIDISSGRLHLRHGAYNRSITLS